MGGLLRRFGVVKLWPELHAAEDENLARIQETAKSLGLECVAVDPFGQLIEPPHTQLGKDDLDFVIYLHFEVPKACDIFSFVALWNPLNFFYEWGYRQFSGHLVTHDDFLSCSSPWADDHVRRLLVGDSTRLPPALTMYHSLSAPILPPTVGECKLAYVGINWERIGKQRGRHQEILEGLDKTGDLRIYGPKIFRNVDVWQGFQSYVRPLPFDGSSIIHEIHKCGISLVLSSSAHIQSELMSNRLFESLAAGAVVLSDQNPFCRRFFGDALLYIDTTLPAEDVLTQIETHLEWIKEEPEEACELARRAQAIFLEQFTLDRSLQTLYERFETRRQELEAAYRPALPDQQISVMMLVPEFVEEYLDQRLRNVWNQRNVNVSVTLVVSLEDVSTLKAWIEKNDFSERIRLLPVCWFERRLGGARKRRNRRGEVLWEILKHCEEEAVICIVAPNEFLYENHLSLLLHVLQSEKSNDAAHSHVLLRHKAGGKKLLDVQDKLDVGECLNNKPIGYARFLIRKKALPSTLGLALPYLDRLAMNLLVSTVHSQPAGRATVQINIQDDFNKDLPDLPIGKESEIVTDYAPECFATAFETPWDELEPRRLSFQRLSEENKTLMAVELAHSVPLPSLIKKLVFGIYRWCMRTSSPG